MKNVALIALILCSACRTVCTEDATPAVDTGSIEHVVRDQEAAWNRGDIDGFMSAGYLRSEELTFFSGGSVTHGFDPVLARYTKRYKSEGKEMGKLAFTQLEVLPLAADVALARGRWDLDFATEKDVGGLFSLVFRHTADGWRIVHDHTSVDGVSAESAKAAAKDCVRILAISCDLSAPSKSSVRVRYLRTADAEPEPRLLRIGDALAPRHPEITVEAIEPGRVRFRFSDGRPSESLVCSEFDEPR